MLDQENEKEGKNLKLLTLKQTQEYLSLRKKDSVKLAFATFLCIISPIPLIGFTTLCDYASFHITESRALSIGLSFLIICIMIAVILFCRCAFKANKYEFLEGIAVCFLLLFVSIGRFFFVYGGTYQNALDKILQIGDYSPKQKKLN